MFRSGLVSSVIIVALVGCSQEEDPEASFELTPTIAEAPADPLAAADVESCLVYQAESCVAGKQRQCRIYDVDAASFVDQPDPLLEKVYLYDRWYDLHSSPMGLTAERTFNERIAGDMSEAEWSQLSRFNGWAGAGDAGIWTGAALVSDAFRYAVNGTEADYQRMEDRVRALLKNFDITGVPGYLARYHFIGIDNATPQDDRLILEYGEPGDSDIDIRPEVLASVDLPSAYNDGLGTPRWNGDPSIDQYTGPMMAFPIVHGLLRDEAMKNEMTRHLTCYLKRLERIEVINLLARPDLLEELKGLFGGSALQLDPGDPDLTKIKELVWYVHPGINRTNAADFVGDCPDKVQLEPSRVLDARSSSFELDLLTLAADINRDARNQPNQIDHFYVVNLRGGDASHLIHLASVAYFLTGDPQYKDFIFDELIGNIGADEVAKTMMAFRLPDWCFKFYGDHITYGTHWQMLTMLPDGELKDDMLKAMHEDAWEKALYNHDSAKFNVMYASVVPESMAPNRAAIVQSAIDQLEDFGGNDGVKMAPRRTYTSSVQVVIDTLPSDISVRCPTEEERMQCEARMQFFGIDLEGKIISRECDGRPGECVMDDGMCTDGVASSGLPARMRAYGDFMWQRSPFTLGANYGGGDGRKQSPGRDLTEPYWMARYYGMIAEGDGHVLAWEEVGSCE